MKPREQGDWGELQAITWFGHQGWPVLIPVFHSPDYDLVTEIDGRLVRVQVKTSRTRVPTNRWEVKTCTSGGNQSWSRVVKRLDADRCDYLFVAVADGRRWFIPMSTVTSTTCVCVGGPKYEMYEVEPGPPMPVESVDATRSRIA